MIPGQNRKREGLMRRSIPIITVGDQNAAENFEGLKRIRRISWKMNKENNCRIFRDMTDKHVR